MSINGIWSTEICGAYGWEPISTVFLENGHYIGGGRNHYSSGHYEEKANGSVVFKIDYNQFGQKRPLFGQKSEKLSLVIKARRDGDVILGAATTPKKPELGITVRFKKRGKLPKK